MFAARVRGRGRITTAGAAGVLGAALVLVPAPAGAGPVTADGAAAFPAVEAVDLQIPGQGAAASRISEAGVVVGVSYTAEGRSLAFRWQDGVATLLGAEHGLSNAQDVNEAGQVLVQTYDDNGSSGAVLWQEDGTVTQVSPADRSVNAYDLDDAGRVALEVVDESTWTTHAAVWQDGTLTYLDDQGGESTVGTAGALNEAGDVVGTVTSANGTRAVVWRDGVATVLPVPAGVVASYGEGVNQRGDVLGSVIDGSRTRAVMWERGKMRYLVKGEAQRQSFYDVSDKGIAVGTMGAQQVDAGPALADRFGAKALPTLGGPTGTAYAVNSHGVVVGTTTTGAADPYGQAVAWVYNRPITLSGDVDDQEPVHSVALDVDDQGRAVGYVQRRGPGESLMFNTRALLWQVASS